MRKIRPEGQSIIRMLQDELERCRGLAAGHERLLADYPMGSLVRKKITMRGKAYEYVHLQWREGGKVKSVHVRGRDLEEVRAKIEMRDRYKKNLKKIKDRILFLELLLRKSPT